MAAYMDNANYLNDPRVIAAARPGTFESVDESTMTATFRLGKDSYTVGIKYEVCDLCSGKGTHVNPSIDAGGFDPHEDDEYEERYFSGSYDVSCSECKGRRVVPVPKPRHDADRAAISRLEKWQDELAHSAALQRAELLAGA